MTPGTRLDHAAPRRGWIRRIDSYLKGPMVRCPAACSLGSPPDTIIGPRLRRRAMFTAQLLLFSTSAAIALLFGIRYLLAREFMPYHATVAGRAWQQLDAGVRAIILGMLRTIGGGLITAAAATVWLTVALLQGVAWAPWALLTVTLTSTLPALYVTLWLRRVQPAARTPVLPAAVALVIGVVGSALSLVR